MQAPSSIGQAAGAAAFLAGKAVNQKSWKDRIKQAAYTSPKSKTRILFDYEDVSRGFTLRGTQFDFPDVDDSYIQQRGNGSRKYPLTCYFTGKDCDRIATAFEAALLEPGIGKLEHPIYGTFPVVPFGDVERNDALKNAANQSVVSVTFFTTVGAVYPSARSSALNEIASAIEGFNVAAAQQLVGNTNLKGVANALAAGNTFKAFLKKVRSALKEASSAVASVRKDFANGVASINEGMDVLIGTPLLLAQQCSNLIQAPGRALAGLESRLQGYDILLKSVISSTEAAPGNLLGNASILLSHQTRVANNFHISNLFALSAISGTVVSVAAQPISRASQGLSIGASSFSTRTQVVAAAAAMLDQLDTLVAWRDGGFAALAGVSTKANYQIDTGEAIAALHSAVALAAGYLIQASFSLLPERAIVLSRDRTIIDLCAELYGSVDDKLDLLISTNNLTGDQILELPKGKRIVYYPE
jgi:prophage DNA circulation protein